MKPIFLCALLPLVCWGLCSSSVKDETTPTGSDPAEVTDSVACIPCMPGDSLCVHLYASDEVKAYELTYCDSVAEEGAYPFVRSAKSIILSPEQKQQLFENVVGCADNYRMDSIIVMSPYLPALELAFYNNSDSSQVETGSIIVSFSDHSWGIFLEGVPMFNYNYVNGLTFRQISESLQHISSIKN